MDKKDAILQNIYTRRSIRKYTKQAVDPELIKTVIKAGMYAPSAVNKQPWHFIVFDDRKIFNQIMSIHSNAGMLEYTPVAILVCGDEMLAHAPGYIPCDCSAATQNMLLAAHALGLGAVWIGLYPREQRIEGLKKVFNLPDHIVPFSIVSLGYPDEKKKMTDRFKEERVHNGKW
jgi:nitroreductase